MVKKIKTKKPLNNTKDFWKGMITGMVIISVVFVAGLFIYFKFFASTLRYPPTNSNVNSQSYCTTNCPYKPDDSTDIDCVVGCMPCVEKCNADYRACQPANCPAGFDFSQALDSALQACYKQCIVSSF